MAEFATPVASNLVSKLGEYLFAPIGRQFGYVLCYKSYVQDLKNGVDKLETARERVHHSVQEAKNNGKHIEKDIEKWLESVENEATQARNLLKHAESAKNACFYGWLPNPMARHPIGRKVKKMTPVIQKLHDESTKNIFQKVFYEDTPTGIVTTPASAARSVDKEDVLESRASITEDVVKAIADNEVSVIGVYGPGGVGKSKLLEDVERRVKEGKLFDVVATANLSRNPNLKEIQGEIAYALGLKLTNDEPARGRADRLRKRLENDSKEKILIILDNLWEKLELKEVGIPCKYDNKVRGCKLLLSSRYRDVLHNDMVSDREFRLNELKHEEARILFERTVANKVNDPEFEPLLNGVVKNCGGLPLLIVSLAKKLKHRDLTTWRNASTNIEGSDVKSLVELNYNDLKDERIRSLFLFCAMKSGRMFVGHSLACCMGLGLYKKFNTLEDARDRLIMDIHRLQDSSLLLDSGDMEWSKIHDMIKFKMHDIFVDVGISIASAEWNALVGRKDCGFQYWSKDELKKCTAISFPYVGIDELPERLDCPNLRMLLLLENTSPLKIPESFFESMEKLQVLDLTSFSFTSLPSSIKFLENLKSLCLDGCHLEDVTILGKLKGLEFLSFCGSVIHRLPRELGELTKLRCLNLTWCTMLKVIEPGVLGSLINLEELYMEDSFDQWEIEDKVTQSNASLAELKNMKKLSTLYIAIPYSACLPRDLPFEKLNKYKIQIGGVWDWSGKYTESRILKLKLDSGNPLLKEWVSKCLQKAQDLHLDGSQDGINSIHDLCNKGFQELKHLHVQNSHSFQYVVHSTENVQLIAFTRLESLFLENLNNLDKICHGCHAPKSFSKLKIVKVDNCSEIKHLFHLSMKRIISQLEEIEISKCHLMQQIVADYEPDEDGVEIDEDTKVKLGNLRRLILRDLPKMMSFYKTADHPAGFFHGQQVSLPWLESLTLSELPELKEIWNSQFPSDVSNLKFLKVEDCAFLVSIFPSNLVIKLQNLEAITIERCQFLRNVFNLEGLIASGNVEILSRLTTLTLSDLPRLEHIWNKNPRIALCFRNLRVLKVQDCENLRFIFSSSMAKALQQIKEIKIVRCKLLKEIIDMQEEESEKAASMDTIEFPLLSSLSLEELPNLRTFSHGTHRIHCPTLTRLRISRCPKMMTFSSFNGRQQSMTADTSLEQLSGHINSGLSLPSFFNEKGLFPSLEELKLSSMGQLKRIWHNPLHGLSFCKLASLIIEFCENLSQVFPSNLMDRLQSLNEIEVVSCPSLEALFEPTSLSSEKRQKPLVLSALKKMKLSDLPSLRDLLKSDCKITLAFPSLMEVNVRRCHGLPYLFSSATAKTLDKLTTVDVSCCNNLQGIIAMEEGKGKTVNKFKFRNLTTLKLGNLENLICFNSESCDGDGLHPLFDEKVQFPAIESMEISQMPNVEKIWIDELASDAFTKLKMLRVKYCKKLASIFSSDTILARFRKLEILTVIDCGSLEVIFPVEEINMSKATTTSSFLLRQLKLKRLPKLKHVWSGHPGGTLKFECLKCFKATECESLQSLFPSSVAKSMTQLEQLLVTSCGMEEIIAEEDGAGTSEGGDLFFPGLTELTLEELPELRSFYKNTSIWPLLPALFHAEKLIKLQNLEAVTVERCQLIREVFDLEELTISGDIEILWQLTSLTLDGLPSLERIWSKNPRRASCFRNLKALKVENCENLRFLFSSSMAKALVQINEIKIASCVLMEEIMHVQEEELEEATATDTLEFPLLTSLSLVDLPNLKTFSYGKYCIHYPSLTRLTISGCPKMMTFSSFEGKQQSMTVDTGSQQALGRTNSSLSLPGFFNEKLIKLQNLEAVTVERCQLIREVFDLEELTINGDIEILWQLTSLTLDGLPSLERIWSKNPRRASCFRNLKALKVENCENLRFLFSSSMAKALVQINEIKIASCVLMEEIMHVQEEELEEATATDTLEFPLLTSLSLVDLPNLKTFSYGKYCIHYPSLTRLTISGCPKMMTFSSFEGNQQSMTADIGSQQALGRTNSGLSLPGFFNEKVRFPSLEELELSSMCQLKRIWHNQLHGQSFCKLSSLTVELCENLSHVFPSNLMDRLQSLNKIEAVGCPSLEALFEPVSLSSERRQKPLVLSALKKMKLLNLPSLREILMSDCKVTLAFPSLMEVNVRRCHSLPYLFSSATAKTLDKLAVLDVSCCNNLCGIIAMEEGKGKTIETFKFRHLTKLKLSDLKSLIYFTSESCAGDGLHPLFDEKLAFPKLEELHVEGVQQKELWNDKILVESFCHLKVLKVKQCDNLVNVIPSSLWNMLLHCMESLTIEKCPCLRNLFTMSMAKSLGQLRYLGLGGCQDMEYIVTKEEEKPEEATDKVVIPQLATLYLHNMPKLKSFCQGKHISEWPSLKEFSIEYCEAVKVILGDANCRKLEGSSPTHQPLLLVEKVCTHSSLMAYLVCCPNGLS
ncbi:hypothetical protein BT93_B1518 [Corymbia citriodora subsp. variegata]|nr:hypothetical protein BT93_B1518 [Corymbia citriodora subsp. variegata]